MSQHITERGPEGKPLRCSIDSRHGWHGLPTRGGCPGPFPPPLASEDPTPCARCSTGFPVEHTCTRTEESV